MIAAASSAMATVAGRAAEARSATKQLRGPGIDSAHTSGPSGTASIQTAVIPRIATTAVSDNGKSTVSGRCPSCVTTVMALMLTTCGFRQPLHDPSLPPRIVLRRGCDGSATGQRELSGEGFHCDTASARSVVGSCGTRSIACAVRLASGHEQS